LYFLDGLSFRNASKALSLREYKKGSHVAIWKWVQRYGAKRISYKRRRKISEFIIDETQIRVENKYFWIWIAAIEPTEKSILDILSFISRKKHVCCREISKLIGKRLWKTYTFNRYDSGTWYYSYACKFLKLRHIIIFTPPIRKALSKE
jgi:putative transposase